MRIQFRRETPAGSQGLLTDEPSAPALVASVERLFSSSVYRPPLLPVVALRVLELVRSSDVSFQAIVELIESDPLFAASVLRTASTPLYASKSAVRTIQQALLRLGLQTVADICVEVGMNGRVFRAPGYDSPMETIRRHSVGVAHIARLLSQRSGVGADGAFTLGLLHEAGLAAGIIALNTPALWPRRFAPQVVWPVLGEARIELLSRLVKAWQLPHDLAHALSNHLRPSAHLDATRAVLALAERLATDLDLGLPAGLPGPEQEQADLARTFLGLKLGELPQLESDCKRLLERVS